MDGDNNKNKEPKKKSLKELFLDTAKPNERGFSRIVTIEELVIIDARFNTGNGGSWCRDDGPLKDYNIVRNKVGIKIVSVKLDGFNKNKKDRRISPSIRKEIIKKPCVILAIGSQIECDHKDGMYNDKKVADLSTQTLSDFQPLCKGANMAKRTHCNQCKDTHIRFDAKRLGYSESYIEGDASTKSCSGCYWYDPKLFNEIISKDFKKTL